MALPNMCQISSAYLPAKSKITTVISFVARCGLLGLFDVYVARFVALKLLKLKQRRKRKLEQERERQVCCEHCLFIA